MHVKHGLLMLQIEEKLKPLKCGVGESFCASPGQPKGTMRVSCLKLEKKQILQFNSIVKQKLQYFGHINMCEGGNLEKLTIFSLVEGKRSRDRQKFR